MSYAIPTSPGEVNSAGREVLKEVLETEKMSDPLLMLKNLPEVRAVLVEAIFNSVPVVKVLPVVARLIKVPDVMLSVVK